MENNSISLRKFPYPYNAALTICNDIDDTKTVDEFLEIQRFLSTKDATSMGEGLGLEIGNSFYFYDNDGDFAFFNNTDYSKEISIELIKSGYLDCLHTYGDAADNRNMIEGALDVLVQNNCEIDVWINHYGAPSNFCKKFEYMFRECKGDDPESNFYHADITLDYGIRFVWVGGTTRVVGQSPEKKGFGVFSPFDFSYPVRSFLSVLKEIRKYALGRMKDERFEIHSQNELLIPLVLKDGNKSYEFLRYCNHPLSVGYGATSKGLAYVISKHNLNLLKRRQGYMIVYTHLGKNRNCREMISKNTQNALRNLESEYRNGTIYVTTTSKLLNYYRSHKYLQWSHEHIDGCIQIHIDHIDDPISGKITPTLEQLQGLTFYVPANSRAKVYLGAVEVNGIQRNPPDELGRESVTLPFTYLNFPL